MLLQVQKAATNIAETAGALDIVCGRSPVSVAAAAIYMATQVGLALSLVGLLEGFGIIPF